VEFGIQRGKVSMWDISRRILHLNLMRRRRY